MKKRKNKNKLLYKEAKTTYKLTKKIYKIKSAVKAKKRQKIICSMKKK